MGIIAKLMGKEAANGRRPSNAQPVSLHRGVQIIAGDVDCCRAAGTLAGQRFLSDEIPKLPLDQCDVSECQCRYKLYDDRRTGERRLSDFRFDVISEMRTDDNQRSGDDDRRSKSEGEPAGLERVAAAQHRWL